MKKKFKVMGDSKNTFLNVELDLVIDNEEVGADCAVLGGEFKITQNGQILSLANKDWTLTLMDITPEPELAVPKLIINETLEIYTETKEVAVKCKCTYEELYYALAAEWKALIKLLPGVGPIPFDYSERLKLFTFDNGWGFENGNFSLLTGGSFSRKDINGRNI